MTPEDISQTYKYGATPARMAGLSEETLLAFAGISKKANMGGDEAGVAFRALVANALSPTRGAKEAMLANGMDYKNYQRMPDKIDIGAFTKTVAAQYGVKTRQSGPGLARQDLLRQGAHRRSVEVHPCGDEAPLRQPRWRRREIQAQHRGAGQPFRDKSMKGVDTDRFVQDLMTAIAKNPALANAFFGSKQGGRIANALGDPETFKHMMEELLHHAEGYSDKVSGERSAGFDGAKRRLDGAITNVETKLGRAWDNDGNGGALTFVTDKAAKLAQAFAETRQQGSGGRERRRRLRHGLRRDQEPRPSHQRLRPDDLGHRAHGLGRRPGRGRAEARSGRRARRRQRRRRGGQGRRAHGRARFPRRDRARHRGDRSGCRLRRCDAAEQQPHERIRSRQQAAGPWTRELPCGLGADGLDVSGGVGATGGPYTTTARRRGGRCFPARPERGQGQHPDAIARLRERPEGDAG